MVIGRMLARVIRACALVLLGSIALCGAMPGSASWSGAGEGAFFLDSWIPFSNGSPASDLLWIAAQRITLEPPGRVSCGRCAHLEPGACPRLFDAIVTPIRGPPVSASRFARPAPGSPGALAGAEPARLHLASLCAPRSPFLARPDHRHLGDGATRDDRAVPARQLRPGHERVRAAFPTRHRPPAALSAIVPRGEAGAPRASAHRPTAARGPRPPHGVRRARAPPSSTWSSIHAI